MDKNASSFATALFWFLLPPHDLLAKSCLACVGGLKRYSTLGLAGCGFLVLVKQGLFSGSVGRRGEPGPSCNTAVPLIYIQGIHRMFDLLKIILHARMARLEV